MSSALSTRSGYGRLALLVLLSISLVSSGAFDLALSTRIVEPESGPALFMQRWGELPGVVVALAGMFAVLSAEAQLQRGQAFRGAFASLGAGVMLWFLYRPFGVHYRGGVTPLGGVLVATSGAIVSLFVGAALRQRLRGVSILWRRRWERFGRVMLWQLLVAGLVLTQGLKVVWGRTRFRDLDGDFDSFTAWYLPQGITGDMSFPSGHTMFAWLLLPLLTLIPETKRGLRLTAVFAIALWGGFMAAMRVRIGAHFASDVLAATLISLGVYWAATRRTAAGNGC